MAFKAYVYEEALREGGLGEKEARAIAKATEAHVIDEALNKDHFEQTLRAELSAMKYDLLRWTIGIAAGAVFAIVVALLRFQK